MGEGSTSSFFRLGLEEDRDQVTEMDGGWHGR